jgi:D-alanyl-D-alanine carboxypeptidase
MMPDNGFVPFAPRRLSRASDSVRSASEAPAALHSEDEPQIPVAENAPLGVTISGESETDVADEPSPAVDPNITNICADANAACIRAEAIRLAAQACARALHYAVDRNPRLVARFVDEALRAAGSPHNAVVRVASAATSVGVASKEHDFVADSSLELGDVFIDSATGTLGATLEERAELLVRAVAS